MSKTLSQRLCELCGLEYIKYNPNCRVQDENSNICEYYVYKLNFERPENFVALQELVVKHSIFSIDSFGCPKDKSFIVYTMENIIRQIKECKKDEAELMQAIRDYDGWVWG